MRELKYVIVSVCGVETPILFSTSLKHKDVASGLNVVAAGFVELTAGRAVVTTEQSVSVNHASRGRRDERVIQSALD